MQYFGRTTSLSFDDLFMDNMAVEQQEFDMVASKVVMPVSDEGTWFDTLPVSLRKRKDAYEEEFQQKVRDANALATWAWAADLERGMSRSALCCGDEALFTLVGHGLIWHSQRQRPLLAAEWLSAHGVPLREYSHIIGADHVFPCDFMSLVSSGQLALRDIRSLVGNGWHIGSVGSWLMFMLASTELQPMMTVPRPITAACSPKRRRRTSACASSPEASLDGFSDVLAPDIIELD